MAQGPDKLMIDFDAEVSNFERQIDTLLNGKVLYKGESISIPTPKGLNDHHLIALKERYIQAGWKDLIRSDNWVGSMDDGYTDNKLTFKS